MVFSRAPDSTKRNPCSFCKRSFWRPPRSAGGFGEAASDGCYLSFEMVGMVVLLGLALGWVKVIYPMVWLPETSMQAGAARQLTWLLSLRHSTSDIRHPIVLVPIFTAIRASRPGMHNVSAWSRRDPRGNTAAPIEGRRRRLPRTGGCNSEFRSILSGWGKHDINR